MAKLQIDKETLIKHRFWIMIGVIAFLMLIATSWLGTGVADELQVLKNQITEHRSKLRDKSQSHLLGDQEIAVLKNKQEVLAKRKGIVWEEAYNLQNPPGDPFLVWPKYVEKEFADIAFGYEFDPKFVNDYVRKDSYYAQFDDGKGPGIEHGIANIFKVEVAGKPKPDPKAKEPAKDAGKEIIIDPVLFKGGWQNVIRHVKASPGWNTAPTFEEVWLAQEDYWVQRELLRALKQANDTVGHFVPVEGAGKADTTKEEIARQRFINGGGNRDMATWQLDLSLITRGPKFHLVGKITNIGRRKQALGKIYFFVRVNRNETLKPIVLEVQGEELGIGKDWKIDSPPLEFSFKPDGVYSVDQIFDDTTSPIRRIDQIAMYRLAHRVYQPALKKAKFSEKLAGTAAARDDLKPDEAAEERTENGLARARYFDNTDQVRRIPFGVVAIVDQAYIPEILTTLSNSKLRFQTTQVNLQHFRGSIKDDKKDGLQPAIGDEGSSSLVELSVYGIASIYERPPKKKEDTEKKAE
jgi:hypothetical protein